MMNAPEREQMLSILEQRFNDNPHRHEGIVWAEVLEKLKKDDAKLNVLLAMEKTGGEPDVIDREKATGEFIFCDCAAQSPSGRRNLCYDNAALESRKKNKPVGSAVGMAEDMGVELLSEEQYQALQAIEEFDTKTSSWILTPEKIRLRGGALFCDRRFDHVFVYHNGAESYYASRGFRALLRV